MQTGIKPLVRLLFSNGQELRCTPNHRFWTTNRGWVAAEDIVGQDHVLLNDTTTPATDASWALPVKVEALATSWNRGGTKVHQAVPERWSTALGELTGHLIGDGCLTRDQAIWVYGGDDVRDGVTDRHAELLQELFGGRSRAEMANGTTQLRLGSSAVRALLTGIGISDAPAHEKKVPRRSSPLRRRSRRRSSVASSVPTVAFQRSKVARPTATSVSAATAAHCSSRSSSFSRASVYVPGSTT